MERNKLEKLLCWKLDRELRAFKRSVLKKDKTEILSMAYKIDHMINLYELVLDLKDRMSINQLKFYLEIPDLLTFLYLSWLETPDSRNDDLENTIWSVVIPQEQLILRRA